MKKQQLQKFKFDYNAQEDNFFVYNPNEKVKSSIEVMDLSIDLNASKEIAGIEFNNASKYFEKSQIDLNNVTSCKVAIEYIGGFVKIRVYLQTHSQQEIRESLLIPSIKQRSPSIAIT